MVFDSTHVTITSKEELGAHYDAINLNPTVLRLKYMLITSETSKRLRNVIRKGIQLDHCPPHT